MCVREREIDREAWREGGLAGGSGSFVCVTQFMHT